jgi:hypothetical protein
MFGHANREHRMTDIAAIASSITTAISKQTAELGKAADATRKSFADTLFKVETTIGLKQKTGFSAGPTYEANSLTGQTRAALNNAADTVKSALHIPR